MGNERDSQRNQKYEKQYLRDRCRSSGDAAKAENAGNQRDNEKYKCPIKH